MIYFDEELRQFSTVENREFGVPLTAVLAGGHLLNKMDKRRRPTFWGQFNGKNRALREAAAAKQARQLARIEKGTDNRGFLKSQLEARNARLDKKLDKSYEYKGKKLEANKDLAESALEYKKAKNANKANYKSDKLRYKAATKIAK